MIINNVIYKYDKKKAGDRLSFFASKYKSLKINNEQFHTHINQEYYKVFSILYKKRCTLNIEKALNLIIKALNKYKFENIYDIGAGEGFLNKIFKKNSIKYDNFYNCDPYQYPIIEDNKSTHLKINFDQTIDTIAKSKGTNLVTLCSTIHHMIEPEKEISNIAKSMKKGDLILIAHEPMNTIYSTIAHLIMKVLHLLSEFHINKKFKNNLQKRNKYDQIINSLEEKGIISDKLTELHIRRIVDYQVGYKLDYLKLSIPKDKNEGYWSIKDTCTSFHKNNLKIIKLIKYPYISTKFKKPIQFINNFFFFFRLNTQYSILAIKYKN